MGLDRSVHSDETADGVTLPVAPGAVVRGDLAQTFTPPPPIFALSGRMRAMLATLT